MFQEIFFINGLKYQLSILKREVIQGKKLRIVNFSQHETDENLNKVMAFTANG